MTKWSKTEVLIDEKVQFMLILFVMKIIINRAELTNVVPRR